MTPGVALVFQKNTKLTIAVTDPYVSHPYRVFDVFHFLNYKQRMGTLSISYIANEDFNYFSTNG